MLAPTACVALRAWAGADPCDVTAGLAPPTRHLAIAAWHPGPQLVLPQALGRLSGRLSGRLLRSTLRWVGGVRMVRSPCPRYGRSRLLWPHLGTTPGSYHRARHWWSTAYQLIVMIKIISPCRVIEQPRGLVQHVGCTGSLKLLRPPLAWPCTSGPLIQSLQREHCTSKMLRDLRPVCARSCSSGERGIRRAEGKRDLSAVDGQGVYLVHGLGSGLQRRT